MVHYIFFMSIVKYYLPNYTHTQMTLHSVVYNKREEEGVHRLADRYFLPLMGFNRNSI